MGRPKRTLKRSVKLEDPGSAAEAKKVRKIVAEELPEFNPWAVEDVSVFLKYNCPECKFNDNTLKGFTEHALERHPKAKSFFTAENIAEQFRLDRIIKTEEPEPFQFENYDLEQPDPFAGNDDYFGPDPVEPVEEDRLEEKRGPKPKKEKTKRVRRKMWHYTIQTNQDNFSCKKTKQEFDTKLDATKYFIETHLDKDEKFEACQVCVEVYQAGRGTVGRHYNTTHPEIEKHYYTCKICTEYPPTASLVKIIEHFRKDHPERPNLLPYQCINCEKSFHFYEEILAHEKNDHGIPHIINKCPDCPMTYLSEQLLTLHKHSHAKEGEPAPVWCSFCEFTSTDQQELVIHKDKDHAHELPKFFCEICVVEFTSRELLDKHKVDTHRTGNKYNCKFCDYKTFEISWNKLLYHIDVKHSQENGIEKKHFCPKCNKGFAFESSKRIHKQQLKCGSGIEKTLLVCDLCGKQCTEPTKMKEHMLLKHNFEGKTKLVCEKCGFSTISKHKLRSHIREKHEIEKHKKCPYCEYSSHQSTKILIHIDIKHPETGEKQFQCDKCQATFIYEQSYANHVKFKCKFSSYVRPGETRMKLGLNCDYCNEVFNSDYRAKNHYKSKHPGKPIIAKGFTKHHCNICSDFFFTEESYGAHLNLDHGMETEKSYCKKCRLSYTDVHLNCPRNWYKKDDPFKKDALLCPHCKKTYSSKQYLKEHVATVHENQRYGCNECDKTFSSVVHLKSHYNTKHLKCEAFVCNTCGKKYGSLNTLRNHKRQSHTQMTCEVCQKQVNNPSELKKHMVLVHNDTKNAWICEICPKKVFFTKAMYEKHVQTKH